MPSSCFRSMRCNSLLAPSFDEFWVRYGWKNMEPSSPYPLEDPWSIWSEARWQIHGENSSILYWIFYTWMLKETLRRSLSANSSGLFRTNIGSQQRWHRPPPTHGSASETPFAHLQVLEKRVPLLLASLLIGLWQKAVCLRLVRERFQQCNNGKQLKATVVNSISPSSESRTACWPLKYTDSSNQSVSCVWSDSSEPISNFEWSTPKRFSTLQSLYSNRPKELVLTVLTILYGSVTALHLLPWPVAFIAPEDDPIGTCRGFVAR